MANHGNTHSKIDLTFATEVEAGLAAPFKRLPSKYFYDAIGDVLFQEIMHMPEYYLTRSEYEVLSMHSKSIYKALQFRGRPFDVVEFGAGDGLKTKVLLREFLAQGADLHYVPIDFSSNVLEQLSASLEAEMPHLKVRTMEAEYFEALETLKREEGRPKLVLFLGSNIGNFTERKTNDFLQQLFGALNPGDFFLLGYDLKKDPSVILKAYNDAAGITRRFNLNLLDRINSELGANFNVAHFDHYPTYDPETGFAKSYLTSKRKQEVYIEALDRVFSFEAGECIHTEISRKYSLEQMEQLLAIKGFDTLAQYSDSQGYFAQTLSQKPVL